MIRPRSDGVILPHGPSSNARRAARTARLMSSASPSAIWASVSPVAGLGVSNVLPVDEQLSRGGDEGLDVAIQGHGHEMVISLGCAVKAAARWRTVSTHACL